MDWKDFVDRLNSLVRLRATPVGIKGFATIEGMDKVAKLRKPKHIITPCQAIGQAIQTGITIGFTREDIVTNNCNAIIGLERQDEKWRESVKYMFRDVWWNTEEDVANHHKSLTQIPEVRYQGIVVSPLISGRIEPEVCMITGTPGALFMLMSGYLRNNFNPLDIRFVGESSCSMTWVKTLYTGEIGFSTPCFAEMRFAGIPEENMILTLKPADLVKAIEGLEQLSRVGMRYPVPSYGAQMDVREGVGVTYK